jgi:outer membrane protein OmpA-like peptidoglycan-associated protein
MYVRTERGEGLAGLAQPPQTPVWSCHPPKVLDDFLVGDYKLRPAHYKTLASVRAWVNSLRGLKVNASVALVGHTDGSGEDDMNKGLSENRAYEVKNFLTQSGVPVHDVKGMGKSSPVAPNTTEAGRRKNRRVEIRVCAEQPPPLTGQPA